MKNCDINIKNYIKSIEISKSINRKLTDEDTCIVMKTVPEVGEYYYLCTNPIKQHIISYDFIFSPCFCTFPMEKKLYKNE